VKGEEKVSPKKKKSFQSSFEGERNHSRQILLSKIEGGEERGERNRPLKEEEVHYSSHEKPAPRNPEVYGQTMLRRRDERGKALERQGETWLGMD